MEKSIEMIRGDTDGVVFEFPVFRFRGSSPGAPSAYIQAALHSEELPGVVAIDRLMPKLRKAESEGRIRGALTIVPRANPIGPSQQLFGAQGRFHLGSRTNFNRDFPLLETPDTASLAEGEKTPMTADKRLKSRLLQLSIGHDIVLDLHCDDEGVSYLYVPKALWPAMADCAVALGAEAVVLWDGPSDGSFDEASIHPYLAGSSEELARRVVTTVEYRGILDVERDYAERDAEGLYRFLVARGLIEDGPVEPLPVFSGVAAPIDHMEMVSTPLPGAILYDVLPGQRVTHGMRVATIVHTPGEQDGTLEIFAPQSGFVLTRLARRSARAGDDIVKIVGDGPSRSARSGALED